MQREDHSSILPTLQLKWQQSKHKSNINHWTFLNITPISKYIKATQMENQILETVILPIY